MLRKPEFVLSPFMLESKAFSSREPVGVPLPAPCVQMLVDALDVFEEEPEIRERTTHAFKGAKGYWGFSLMGLIAAEQGLDLVETPCNQQIVPVRDFLSKVGFTYYDQLCLGEINHHSLNIEVLRERVLRFAQTGERMPFLDDLHEINTKEEEDG